MQGTCTHADADTDEDTKMSLQIELVGVVYVVNLYVDPSPPAYKHLININCISIQYLSSSDIFGFIL